MSPSREVLSLSSPTYEGRHRSSRRGLRLPRPLRAGLILPTAAAGALVVTATGATVAQSSPLGLSLGHARAASAHAGPADVTAWLATETPRRQQAAAQTAAVQAHLEQQQRAARSNQRKSLAAKAAAAAEARAEAAKAAQAAKAAAKVKGWQLPLAAYTLTSGFGVRWGRLHAGEDFACPVGTPLKAMSSGTVTFAGQESGFGNLVKITYWDGTESYYGHMSSISAAAGQKVAPGEIVGLSGNTGHSTGPHLHLEIHPSSGEAIDPLPWLAEHGIAP